MQKTSLIHFSRIRPLFRPKLLRSKVNQVRTLAALHSPKNLLSPTGARFVAPNRISILPSTPQLKSSSIAGVKMAEQIQDNSAYTGVHLPDHCVPLVYDLNLTPNLKDFTFDGTVSIEYKSTEANNTIVVNAVELEIKDGYINDPAKFKLTKVIYSKAHEVATLVFSEAIPDSGKLFLRFSGILNNNLKGFYRTAYRDNAGKTYYAATTQFEPVDARRAFPCWDEPAIKARFSVTLTYSNEYETPENTSLTALSNMEVESTSVDGDRTVVKFAETPIVSTYLLAFILAPLEVISAEVRGRKVNVYTFPGKIEHGGFALDVACKSLKFFEDYFKIDYPLKKLDLVAIPDFMCGAMENWGLVTYRETALLFDPVNTSTARKQYVATTVAHELAHQWFGNLVTMEWWTHLWLNEGFASFMQYLCTDNVLPEFDVWSQFSIDDYSMALELDAMHNSHPIEVPIKHPSEIDEIFDHISYCKGASVIRMLHNYIGDESFRKGLHNYLKKHAYKNAKTEDLWDALQSASGKPVTKLMSCWTLRKGFPMLTIDYKQEGDKAILNVTQTKFTSDGKLSAEDAQSSWMVPISVVTASSPTTPVSTDLLEGKTASFSVPASQDEWIKLNPGSIGLYRTVYPEEMVKKLWPAVSNKTLSPADRLGLQNDYFALCQAGIVSTVDLLKLLRSFKNEDNFPVWSSIDSCLGDLGVLFSNTDFVDKLKGFGRELYREIFNKLGWEPHADEKHTEAMSRTLVINRLVSFGDPSIIDESIKKFRAHLDKTQSIPADLRSALYRAVARYGDEADFEKLFEVYRTANLNEEKNRVLGALGYSVDPKRIERVIEFFLSDEVRKQDKFFIIVTLSANKPLVAWKLFQDKKDWILSTWEAGAIMIRMVSYCTKYLYTEEQAREVEEFFKANKFPGTERTVRQSIESIRLNVSWLSRDAEAVRQYLSTSE